MNRKALAIASLPLKVYEGEREGEREYAPSSALAKVLRKPFPRARTFRLPRPVRYASAMSPALLMIWPPPG